MSFLVAKGCTVLLTLLNPIINIDSCGNNHRSALIFTFFGPDFTFQEQSLLENVVSLWPVLLIKSHLSFRLLNRWVHCRKLLVDPLLFQEIDFSAAELMCGAGALLVVKLFAFNCLEQLELLGLEVSQTVHWSLNYLLFLGSLVHSRT